MWPTKCSRDVGSSGSVAETNLGDFDMATVSESRSDVHQVGTVMKKVKKTAVYMRVSTGQQSTRSQRPDLERWVAAQDPAKIGEVVWFQDKASGKSMNRPQWQKLEGMVQAGKIGRLVVWRLDRLGRTASGLTRLFELLQEKKVRLISLMDGVDLGTASGRLIANVLASVASYETEIRGERVRAGQAAARAAGKRWGGAIRGRRLSVTDEQVAQIVKLKKGGEAMEAISRATGVSRRQCYNLLGDVAAGIVKVG